MAPFLWHAIPFAFALLAFNDNLCQPEFATNHHRRTMQQNGDDAVLIHETLENSSDPAHQVHHRGELDPPLPVPRVISFVSTTSTQEDGRQSPPPSPVPMNAAWMDEENKENEPSRQNVVTKRNIPRRLV